MRHAFSPLLTRQEAAQLSGVGIGVINKAIEQKLIATRRRTRRTMMAPEEVGPLALLKQMRVSLPVPVKRRVAAWARSHPAADEELHLSDALVVRMTPEIEQAMRRARRYVELRERLVEVNPEIRGGEPVIKGTRVPLRGLARQIELGETVEVLREDYPFLPEEAFELAPLWASANPRRGRPPRPWAAEQRSRAEPARAATSTS